MRLLPRRGRSRVKLPKLPRAQRWLVRYGWLVPLLALFLGGGILVLTYAFASIPLPKDIKLPSSAEVFDRNGHLIGTYSNEVRRFLIDTTELPDYVGQAVIASEDRDFFEHGGISLKGIARAAWANLTGGEIQQGGSTIAQQYIKNAVLRDPERTLTRKIKEAILAIKLERRYSKRQILGFYLNTIYLGRGAYGVEAAARAYFGEKHATDLTLPQAAFLAGIIPGPERYQPDDNPLGAKARRDHVLDLMAQQGYISRARADHAQHGRVHVVKVTRHSVDHQRAAYFMEWLRKDYLYPEYGECLYTCGLKIHTTLDLHMQDDAERAVSSILTEPEDPEAALVSVTPDGAVRAFVGGRDFTDVAKARGFDYASDPPGRHPGSSLKPFTLLTAIEEGISPSSRFSGRSPVTIPDPECYTDGAPWEPSNYGDEQYGTITLDQATTNSVNTVYAQLIARVGDEKVAATLDDFGFDGNTATDEIDDVTPNCSLALGALDVTPVEQARAYAGFAGQGLLPKIQPITHIDDSNGDCLKEYRPVRDLTCAEDAITPPKRVADQNSVNVLTEVLTHVVEGGTATAANIGRPVAGKTGTTQDNKDAWFAGYIPQLTTVVWEGYPIQKSGIVPQMQACGDPERCRPVHGYTVTGGGAPVSPAVIWAAYMKEAVAELAPEPFPAASALPSTVINSPAPYSTYRPSPASTEGPAQPKPSKPPNPRPSAPPSQPPPPSVAPSATSGLGHRR